jgi:hypothetical protein
MQRWPDRRAPLGPDRTVVDEQAVADHRGERLLHEAALALVGLVADHEDLAHHLRVVDDEEEAAGHAEGHDLALVRFLREQREQVAAAAEQHPQEGGRPRGRGRHRRDEEVGDGEHDPEA